MTRGQWLSAIGVLFVGVLLASDGLAQNKALSSAMVQVEEGSFIRIAPSRDADVTWRTKKGGELKVRFDKLKDLSGNDINATGNRLDVEVTINGGAPQVLSFFFDIAHDSGEVDADLGLTAGDLVEIRRIDAYDPNGDRFATLGVRIQNPSQ